MPATSQLLTLSLLHGMLPLPAYLPDATQAFVRGADSRDLRECGVQALVMNVFHLMQRPGAGVVESAGGLHAFASWPGPIVTDSGGFQAYSLIRTNPSLGRITDRGIRYRAEAGAREIVLTAEKSVQQQVALGADALFCLDDCTQASDPHAEQERAVARTIDWARRGKEEYLRQVKQRKPGPGAAPLLLAAVQGGADLELRRLCAAALLEIGFHGFGFGGWPLDEAGNPLLDLLGRTRELIPPELPMHALGVGSPETVAACARMGYDLFDSALPTRDARSGRLYAWREDPATSNLRDAGGWRSTLYIDDEKHIRSREPASPFCDCLACSSYSLAYLRHLRRCADPLYVRLATIHNLRFMAVLMARLQEQRQQQS